ncbi:MAG: hypothetical protein AAFV54_15515, partial [Pseudomonadota bacterium]
MPQTAPDYTEKMGHLERVFQSANILRECACNWRDGLISEPFNWYLKGQDGERTDSETDTTAAEAEQQLQRWLDWVEQQAIATDPACTNFQQSDPWAEFVLSLGVTGEGALRLWQPERYAESSDPVHRVHLHAPQAGSVRVERNEQDGFIDKIRYAYYGGDEAQTMEGDRVSIDVPGTEEPLTLDTQGRWLIQYITGESVFTPSVKRLQNALNHALTMMVRNSEVAGFRERVFMNAEYPTDDDGNPIDIQRGPGIDAYT